ncbi:MAG: pilus assembly protein [Acidobacteriia bacterium]|nr:pilus assembly protein [Terriglobia bacterium]
MKKRFQLRGENGNSMLEFALVMSVLVPVFAGMFTIGMTLSKGIQVSNVCQDAVVLMVRSNTDPNAGLDLSLVQNQRMIIRAAAGLGMNSNAQYDPSATGNGVVILSKVVMVGPQECATGVVPAPPTAPPWTASNCPNYGRYAFTYRVVIGNKTRWSSTMGNPPTGVVASNGTISASDIAKNTSNVAQNAAFLSLTPSTFALIAEMYADVSYLNLFSIMNTPIIYSRSIS